jgi:16S rRNA (adenine1518-N6/adenine1519-N6)-dimethyltransferase
VRRLLDAHGLAPRKAAGQNFVVDANTVRRIVAAAGIRADDTVLEIGPGLGSLTLGLAEVARRVVAVEIDAGLVRALAETVGGLANVEVVHADALAVSPSDLVGDTGARLVANLPYNVATPLVMHALLDDAVIDLFVMVQREVGERWCAPPGHHLRSGVSVKVDLLAEAAVVLRIPRTVFHPVPNVDSVMVRLRRRPRAPSEAARRELFTFVDAAFRQRRKTLRNNLRGLADPAVLARAGEATGVDLGLRAEALATDRLVALAHALGVPSA